MPPPDPIERVGLKPRPSREVETSRHGLFLAVEVLEQRHQLVALNQDSCRVANQDRAERFIRGIVGHVADGDGSCGSSPRFSAASIFFVPFASLSRSFSNETFTARSSFNMSRPD